MQKPQASVKSKFGFPQAALSLSLLLSNYFFGYPLAQHALGIKTLNVDLLPILIIAFAWALITLPFALFFLTLQVEVSSNLLITKSLLHQDKTKIRDFRRITSPIGYGWLPLAGVNFTIVDKSSATIFVFSQFFRNGKYLNRAILEACYKSNSKVDITPALFEVFGHPPYDIFSKHSNSP